jgi:hypothetical protein
MMPCKALFNARKPIVSASSWGAHQFIQVIVTRAGIETA